MSIAWFIRRSSDILSRFNFEPFDSAQEVIVTLVGGAVTVELNKNHFRDYSLCIRSEDDDNLRRCKT